LGEVLGRFPEKLIELVFAYAPGLPREEILAAASENQFVKAFGQIMEEAYCFTGPLRLMMGMTPAGPRQ
jgi:hypothetical protein